MRSPLLKIEVVDLEKLVELKRQQVELQNQLDEVNRQIEEIVGHAGSGGGGHPEERRRRGEIKNAVIAALKEAGDEGMHTGDMAKQIGLPRLTLEKFLYSRAARETKGLIKIGTAKFKYVDPLKTPPAAKSRRPSVHEHRMTRPAVAAAR